MHYYSDGPISIARGLLRCFILRFFPGAPKSSQRGFWESGDTSRINERGAFSLDDLLSNAIKKRAKVLLFYDMCKYFGEKKSFFLQKMPFYALFMAKRGFSDAQSDGLSRQRHAHEDTR